jgi:hypothetical protein
LGTGGCSRNWGMRLSAVLRLSLTLGMKIITADKTKTMAFKGRDPVRSEIVMNNIIVQLITFMYLCCFVSYQNDSDITVRISKFLHIKGINNRTLKPSQAQNHTRLKNVKLWHYVLYYMDAKLGQLEKRINPG